MLLFLLLLLLYYYCISHIIIVVVDDELQGQRLPIEGASGPACGQKTQNGFVPTPRIRKRRCRWSLRLKTLR